MEYFFLTKFARKIASEKGKVYIDVMIDDFKKLDDDSKKFWQWSWSAFKLAYGTRSEIVYDWIYKQLPTQVTKLFKKIWPLIVLSVIIGVITFSWGGYRPKQEKSALQYISEADQCDRTNGICVINAYQKVDERILPLLPLPIQEHYQKKLISAQHYTKLSELDFASETFILKYLETEGKKLTDGHLLEIETMHLTSQEEIDNFASFVNSYPEKLSNLQELHISNSLIVEVGHLSKLANPMKLYLSNTLISSESDWSNVTNLQELYFSSHRSNDISDLTTLTSLKKLKLDLGNAKVDLVYLIKLKELQDLDLSYAEISGLEHLSELSNLKKLNLRATKTKDLSFLVELNDLEELYLDETLVENLNYLAQLNELRVLSLSYTSINNLSPLTDLSNLRELFLANTEVSDLKPLTKLNLKELYIRSDSKRLVLDRENILAIEDIQNNNSEFTLYLNGDQVNYLDDISLEEDPKVIRIGIITFKPDDDDLKDLDNDERFIGKPVIDTAEVIKEAINSGNIPSFKGLFGPDKVSIELHYADEDIKKERTKESVVDNYKEFVKREKLDLVIGYTFSDNCEFIAEEADKLGQELNVLTILFDCGTKRIFEDIETDPQYLFRTSSHTTMDGVTLARYLEEYQPKTKEIAGLNQHYAWGRDSWLIFESSLYEIFPIENSSSRFIKFTASDDSDIDHCTMVSSLLNSNPRPEILFSSFAGKGLVELIEDISQKECKPFFEQETDTKLILTTGESILPILKDLSKIGIRSQIIITGRGTNLNLDSAQENKLNNWFRGKFPKEEIPNYHGYRMAQALFGVKAAYEKAFDATGRFPEIEDVAEALAGLRYESPSGTIVMGLANGHQAVQNNSIATLKINSDGRYQVKGTKRFYMWCVNPPPHMTSLEWIGSGFEGAECKTVE